ncbi:hypothetical protein ZHAS_00013397 [Anopheles sinensis]|uniref:Uncharacterized protein n=1 Tax=Anopheles sinensis TaxID=74873 RepID=A0A084W5G6_ANOSI|nr:hypothetical protein ZHAS_00013397 [Anopheles sinensis]
MSPMIQHVERESWDGDRVKWKLFVFRPQTDSQRYSLPCWRKHTHTDNEKRKETQEGQHEEKGYSIRSGSSSTSGYTKQLAGSVEVGQVLPGIEITLSSAPPVPQNSSSSP